MSETWLSIREQAASHAMSGLVVAGSAWATASILCGVGMAGWITAEEASFTNLDGILGAIYHTAIFSAIGSFGAAIASLPWMALFGWPVAILLRALGVERWLEFAFAVASSALAGLMLNEIAPSWWVEPGMYAAPLYGVVLGYLNVRFGDA